jgi:hypothetical protein
MLSTPPSLCIAVELSASTAVIAVRITTLFTLTITRVNERTSTPLSVSHQKLELRASTSLQKQACCARSSSKQQLQPNLVVLAGAFTSHFGIDILFEWKLIKTSSTHALTTCLGSMAADQQGHAVESSLSLSAVAEAVPTNHAVHTATRPRCCAILLLRVLLLLSLDSSLVIDVFQA